VIIPILKKNAKVFFGYLALAILAAVMDRFFKGITIANYALFILTICYLINTGYIMTIYINSQKFSEVKRGLMLLLVFLLTFVFLCFVIWINLLLESVWPDGKIGPLM
jgi:hypothetical protein